MRFPALSAALLSCLATAAPVGAQAPAGLADLLEHVLRDADGDSVIDQVRVRLVLPPAPTEAELAAAANLATRLGYETVAATLDLHAVADAATRFDRPVIIIGGTRAAEADDRLAPGEGAITILPAGGRFAAGGALLDGYDATGLLAAGAYASGRFPMVWQLEGSAWADVPAKLRRFLDGRGIARDTVVLERIVVDARRPGVARARLAVRVGSVEAFARAIDALEGRDTAAAAADTTATDSARMAPAELLVQDLHRLDVSVTGADSSRIVRVLPARPWTTREPAGADAPAKPDFTLSDLYTIRGLFRDTNQDLLPDRTDAFLSLAGGEAPAGALAFAMRAGLETAGLRLPFAVVGGQDDAPQRLGLPILFGLGHYQTERLAREGRLHGRVDGAGVGFVRVVPDALADERSAIVVAGGDAAGLGAIADYMARRAPYLWEYGRGEHELSDLENEVRRFTQARGGAGQLALALAKLRQWLDRIVADSMAPPLDSLAVEIAAEDAPAGVDRHVRRIIAQVMPATAARVTVRRTSFGVGDTIFSTDLTIPWEVDSARAALAGVLPRLTTGQRGLIEVRVSEPPEVRRALGAEIGRALADRGLAADAFDVRVLSAYKQGFSWMEDVVLPALRTLDRPVARVAITYHTLRDSDEVRWQTIASDTRWLQELYPIDAILARELGIPDSAVTFEPTRRAAPVYSVRAFDARGAIVHEDTFDPRYVVRPFFGLFPEYEQVRVTTGWIRVVADGDTLLDRRVVTDPEIFWDHLQTQTYARIVDYVMDIQDGRPSGGNAPYFDELTVDLTLSEPDRRIGVDEEVVSALEALHEDIYFETLTLFDLIGNRYGVGGLSYPGRVLPWIHRGAPGPGHARISMTGKATAVPELAVTLGWRDREPERRTYRLSPLSTPAPRLRGVTVRAGQDGLAQVLFDVVATDSAARYDELRLRGSEDAIDRSNGSAELLAAMADAMAAMHGDGLLEDRLAWDRIGETLLRFTLEDSVRWSRFVTLPRTANPASTRITPLIGSRAPAAGERLVQWREPIPPAESDSVLGALATFPGVDVFRVGESFLGQPIHAAAFTWLDAPEGTFVSQSKLTALKPTLFLSGRQHANEVSSTSHILRLGELLATDSTYRELLRRANVLLHPITNPDGARLAVAMQEENPDFMLHAGYLGALGVDATAGAGSDDPIYPEAKVRPLLMERWLPDIYINMHGYPSHEWVQYFAGYSAWVRSRQGGQRSWWAPRGWFIPGFTWVEDEEHPEYERAQWAALDSIASSIVGDSAVEAMNRRIYARYAKYGRQDVENFRESFRNGMLVYLGLRGRESIGTGVGSTRITWFATTTEAPDETARGDWLELVARAGLNHSTALLRYLAAGTSRVERKAEESGGFVLRSTVRKRPVLPPDRER